MHAITLKNDQVLIRKYDYSLCNTRLKTLYCHVQKKFMSEMDFWKLVML